MDASNKHPFRCIYIYIYTPNARSVPYGNADRSLAGFGSTGEERMKNATRSGKCPASLVNRDSPLRKERMIKGRRTAFSIVPFLGLHPV